MKIINDEPFFYLNRKEALDGKVDIVVAHFLAERIGEIESAEEIDEWAWHDINNLPENIAPSVVPALKHFHFID